MDEALDEEICVCDTVLKKEPLHICKCFLQTGPSDQVEISIRKQKVLGTVIRAESYLQKRRIPELIRFLLTKALAHASPKPMEFLEKLLDDCMIFRAGHGPAPVLYENRHLEAVVKSFDPGRRGWLSPNQIRQAFVSLGLTPPDLIEERMDWDVVLNNLRKTQEQELFNLLTAGMIIESNNRDPNSSSPI